jgi:hypothetical protein
VGGVGVGFVCAGITAIWGIGIKELAAKVEGQEKVIKFYDEPWLGLSFICLVMFVVVFTNVRARGVYSFMLVLLAAAIGWGIMHIPGIETAFGWLNLLRVHLNLAFYLTFSGMLFFIWVVVVFLVDHFTIWRFTPGQVIEEHWIGQSTEHAHSTENMTIQRLPDDLFRHKLLGLGMGDFVVKPAHEDAFEIHNVLRANKKQPLLAEMVRVKPVRTS